MNIKNRVRIRIAGTSMKPREPLVDDGFLVVVTPLGDLNRRKLTIPQTFFAPKAVRALAEISVQGKAAHVGCSLWSMKQPQRVSKALRKLADYIESEGRIK